MKLQASPSFSVYNLKDSTSVSPLDFLRTDSESGWHVARNLKKPLNHLETLREKETLATKLNLHNLFTPASLFDFNYGMLEAHQQKKVQTIEVIQVLAQQVFADGGWMSIQQVRDWLQTFASVKHMEFHPSDVCNLTCMDCTYGHDDEDTKPLPINFEFESIQKIASMKPNSMVIIGGGEPTLFVHKKRRFKTMIDELRSHLPQIHLALVTNGTFLPPGDWPNSFDWIRLSLDAASPEVYTGFRGKNMFAKVIQNFLKYLDFDVPQVGISFLFAKSNIHDYAKVARMIFDLVKKEKPQHLKKVNIQYRPLRRDPYKYNLPFTEAVDAEQIEVVVNEVIGLARSSKEMEQFLRNQTNITAILGGNTHPPLDFHRCYYSELFKIVRANGDIRPCFIRVTEPDFILGNIHTDSLEAIALNTLYVAARRKPHCDQHGCRQCHVNHILGEGLAERIAPSSSPEVLADPMF